MSRPKKAVIDYFPHYVAHGKTMYTIENRFGNDGYCFWFKLLEILGSTENHFIDCNKPESWEFLLAKTRVNEIDADNILNLLAKIGAIDSDLWDKKIIWSENFVLNLTAIYQRRQVSVYTKTQLIGLMSTETPLKDEYVNKKPQSIVKESIGEESIGEDNAANKMPIPKKTSIPCPYQEIVDAYHSYLSGLPRIRSLGKELSKHIRSRWDESKERQSIEFWNEFFIYISKSDFLMGRKTDFKASLGWIVGPNNFEKIINGQYDNNLKINNKNEPLTPDWY